MKVAPVYGVWPVSVTATVNCTTDPGVVVDTFAVLTMVSAGIRTSTVAVHWRSVQPDGSYCPPPK